MEGGITGGTERRSGSSKRVCRSREREWGVVGVGEAMMMTPPNREEYGWAAKSC